MLYDVRFSYVRLLIGYPKVFSMEYHHRMYVIPNTSNLFSSPWCSQLSAQSRPHSSALSGSTLLERLFRRSPSNTHDTSPSSSLDWAHNLLTWRGQSGKVTELGGCTPAVMEVPYAKGKRVSSFSISDIQECQLYLSPRETLVRGRSGKDPYPRRTLLQAAHIFQSPMSLSHLCNHRQPTHRLPHMPSAMLP
jgi:hypothetical protein